MKNKKIIYILFILLCLLIIFLFSNQNSNQSNDISKDITNKIVTIYEKVFNKKVNNVTLVNNLHYGIRKIAHFTIFFILGIFVYLLFNEININHKLEYALLFCFICALFDELHQLFVIGRTSQIIDILIDTLGFSASILFINYCTIKNVIKNSDNNKKSSIIIN